MTIDEPFIEALRADHCDPNLWLIYSDFLEDHGDRRAACIRSAPRLPLPWKWLVVGERLVEELQTEVGPGHVLHDRRVTALAHRNGCEDVLYMVEDTSFAVVRLTWLLVQETDPRCPPARVYRTWEECLARLAHREVWPVVPR